MLKRIKPLLWVAFFCATLPTVAQEDSTFTEEEDYSIYDNLDYVDEGTKRFASAKISGISPARLISVGYDYQAGYDITAGAFDTYAAQTARINSTQGIRVGANIPVISKNSIIVQLGGQIWDMNYDFEDDPATLNHPLLQTLQANNLTTVGLNSTIFKPLNETNFILVQLAADMNGDFSIPEFQGIEHTKNSIAAVLGKRPSDYKQWGIGLSRTFRAGEMNYVPILLFNWTSPTTPWGTEILFPARGHVRYTFNRQNMAFFGFELEGNAYRIGNQNRELAPPFDDLQIRRSELRFRFMWQRQLVGFIWVALEAGYRINYSYNVDRVPGGKDFSRYFVLDDPFVMENTLTNPLYFNLSFNLVSP